MSLPLWLRVSALAYGRHRRNGHAQFRTGELVKALPMVDKTTGEVRSPAPSNMARAIKVAKERGFLGEESGLRCLVVPAHAITGGVRGSEYEKCPLH